MARLESDREDLLREASALVDRIELRGPGEQPQIVVGFRQTGAASLFWSADEVYQFDTSHRLRRGFWQGRLIKADQGELVWLQRRRTPQETLLISTPMSPDEVTETLCRLRLRLEALRAWIGDQQLEVLGAVSSVAPGSPQYVLQMVADWVRSLPDDLQIAASPRVQ